MYRFCVIILFILNVADILGNEESDCSVPKVYFSEHLATKTPYRHVKNNNDSTVHFDGCQAKKIWLLVRHGTRNPDEKKISAMRTKLPVIRSSIIKNHNHSRGSLCESELQNLTLWVPKIEIGDQKRLAHEGEDEMVELAERFQNRFPDVLPEDYSNSSFKFRYTATQRTKESLRHFTIGLFGRKVARYVWSPEPIYQDPVLRFYKLCAKWRTEVDKNPDSIAQQTVFEKSEVVQNVIANVSRRLGFTSNFTLAEVDLMYMTCAYETSWNPTSTSPWCSVFSENDMEVMEYIKDLQYYWIDGYGYSINYEQACPLVGDMLQTLKSGDEPKATIYFAHSGTLLKVLAHLGLFKDEKPLTHDHLNLTRLWRVGQVDAFGTNLAFVLFQCGADSKVLSLHQERPVYLPGCPTDSSLCPIETILQHYHKSLNECKFSELCQINGKS